jgi:hypothetical protein
MADTVPSGRRLERAALERVILRAAQLQAGERELEEGLTEEEVLRLGSEVGIPAAHLRQALLEEQTRSTMPAEHGLAAWLAGPRTLAAARTVPGSAAGTEEALEHWMTAGELLVVKRRFPEQTTWEPQRGTMASLKRSFRLGGRDYVLSRATEVSAQVTGVGAHRVYVRLAADVGQSRRERFAGAGLLTGVGAAATGILLALGFATAFAALPAAAAALGAIGIARSHQREAQRVHVALEQVLDRLEHGEIEVPRARPGPAGSLGWIAQEIRKQLGA